LLVLNVSSVNRLGMKDWWERYGFARVEEYDPNQGASGYVGKYLVKADGGVLVSRKLRSWLLESDSPVYQAFAKVFSMAGQSEQPDK
jgi:hypothetical protein